MDARSSPPSSEGLHYGPSPGSNKIYVGVTAALIATTAMGALRGAAKSIADVRFVGGMATQYGDLADRAFKRVAWVPLVQAVASQLTKHWILSALGAFGLVWLGVQFLPKKFIAAEFDDTTFGQAVNLLINEWRQEGGSEQGTLKWKNLVSHYDQLTQGLDFYAAESNKDQNGKFIIVPQTLEHMQHVKHQAEAAVRYMVAFQGYADAQPGATVRAQPVTSSTGAQPVRGKPAMYQNNSPASSLQQTADKCLQDALVYQQTVIQIEAQLAASSSAPAASSRA